jgi:hypothetical protein
MNIKGMVAGGIVSVVVLAGGAAYAAPATSATSASDSAAPKATCLDAAHDDSWSAWVQGRPDAFDAGDLGGTYVWHDVDGWHVRVTHATDDKGVISGKIVTSGKFVDVTGVQLEKNDKFSVGKNGHTITFRFVNYGHIDGLDFRTQCAPSVTFGFARGSHRLTDDRIFVGDHKAHPQSDPFMVRRSV